MILAADNINPMNPVIAEAIEKLDPQPIRQAALAAKKNGAKIIDINPGYLSKRKRDRMEFLVETVQEAVDLRLMLDSPDPDVMSVGLRAARETPILNAVTLEERKIEEMPFLAAEHQADIAALLLDTDSMAPRHLEGKLSVALEIQSRLAGAGVPLEKMIFDPLLPTLGQPDSFYHVAESVKAVRYMAAGAVFGENVRTMVGMSNLRSGQRKVFPVQLEGVCLSMLAGAGLEIALLDIAQEFLTATAGVAGRML